jgi:anti-anti-sigma factor
MQKGPFKEIVEKENYRIIRMKGSFDIMNDVEVEGFIKKFRSQRNFQFKHLILDFQEATFLDTSAVALIVKTMSDYKKSHHKLGIINLDEESRNKKMLELYKVDKLLIIYPSEAAAIEDLENN